MNFAGTGNVRALIEMLRKEYNLDSAKRILLGGTSAGAMGTSGNCDKVGDHVTQYNPNVDFRCFADSSKWFPLPMYNTDECNNHQKENDQVKLWVCILILLPKQTYSRVDM